jgi:hypothetical protein
VAGGGSYYEYQCMQKLELELGGSVQLIYGSDYIFTPEEFLSELSKINKK